METKHTKGKWNYRYLNGYGLIIETPDTGSMNDGKIADVMTRGGGESNANALLISQAPRLLEVLQAVKAWMIANEESFKETQALDELCTDINEVLKEVEGN